MSIWERRNSCIEIQKIFRWAIPKVSVTNVFQAEMRAAYLWTIRRLKNRRMVWWKADHSCQRDELLMFYDMTASMLTKAYSAVNKVIIFWKKILKVDRLFEEESLLAAVFMKKRRDYLAAGCFTRNETERCQSFTFWWSQRRLVLLWEVSDWYTNFFAVSLARQRIVAGHARPFHACLYLKLQWIWRNVTFPIFRPRLCLGMVL